MDAEKVTEKILADARAQAETILKDAIETEQIQTAKLREELANYKRQTELLSQKAADETAARMLSTARMQIAKQILAEKRRILDDVFEQAAERLKKLPDNEYIKLITKLLTQAVQTGDEEVVVDKNERRIDQNFIKKINEGLKQGNLRLVEEREEIGIGFILKRDKIKTDVSVNSLLKQARNNLETELARLFFTKQ